MQDDDTPRHVKHAAKHKRYGFKQWSTWFSGWGFPRWYFTEKARDQALADTIKHVSHYFEGRVGYRGCDYKKIKR